MEEPCLKRIKRTKGESPQTTHQLPQRGEAPRLPFSIVGASPKLLQYDELVQEKAQVLVKKGETSIGILAEELPTWAWYVGALGKIMWVMSKNDIPARIASDPKWYRAGSDPTDLPHVEIVLLQGSWDLVHDQVWSNAKTRLILRCVETRSRNSRGTKRSKGKTNAAKFHVTDNLPADWEAGRFHLAHQKLGGATNGRFQVEWAQRIGSPTPDFKLPPGHKITLGNVVTARDWSGSEAAEPKEEEVNTAKGVLHWKWKFSHVVVPHLNAKLGWVKRYLSAKELGACLDFPGTRAALLSEEELKILARTELPGKLFTASLWFLAPPQRDNRKRQGEDQIDKRLPVKVRRIQDQNETTYQGVGLDSMDPEIEFAGYQEPDDEEKDAVTDKATKADDAAVPEYLWNDRIEVKLTKCWKKSGREELGPRRKQKRNRVGNISPPPLMFEKPHDKLRFKWALKRIRSFALKHWKSKVKRDFASWFQLISKDAKNRKDILADGLEACARAGQTTWWNWDKGSAIFFWRWPPDYQETARIGLAPMFNAKAPTNRDRQPPYGEEETKQKVRSKLQAVIDKGYIEITDIELVEAMMFMFHVPKGETDIRMVYDGTKSGLNDALYSPWFALPTVDTMTRWVLAGSWLADNDYGEQFLNYPLHPDLRKYCGVDLSQLFSDEEGENAGKPCVGTWKRNAMGLKSSPHNSVQASLRAKRLVLGDPSDPENPFAWDKVTLNLPGMEDYNPTQPWILKTRKDGLHAADICQYVDDVRIIAPTEELAWLCSSRMAKGLCWLGLQDAARKRRSPSKDPGAWAGATVSTEGGVVTKGVTQARWDKVKERVRWVAKQIGLEDKYSPVTYGTLAERMSKDGETPPGHIHFKTTESCVGFLVYVSMTYSSMVPYLKGIYLTLNAWRPDRDKEGWPTTMKPPGAGKEASTHRLSAPTWVKPVQRLEHDLRALMELTALDEPPKVPVRATNKEACYIVGDASGTGFGSSLFHSTGTEVHAEYGTWTPKVTRETSSNFRETANLVHRLKSSLESGKIERGSEVFVFTDNSCAERTMYRGSSKSKRLHNMVLDLRKMAMVGDLIIHFVWISGERMIDQGTDGLSRGDFTSGIMAGEKFLKYLPLHKSAIERDSNLEKKIKGWCVNTEGRSRWELTEPKDWFHKVFQDPVGSWIWCPPPAIAKVAVEQMCEVKHLFPESQHLFVCPAIITGVWRKQLMKLADAGITMSAGNETWTRKMFEPLTIALIARPLPHSPWKRGRTPLVERWKDKMQSVSSSSPEAFRAGMRKFWREK